MSYHLLVQLRINHSLQDPQVYLLKYCYQKPTNQNINHVLTPHDYDDNHCKDFKLNVLFGHQIDTIMDVELITTQGSSSTKEKVRP